MRFDAFDTKKLEEYAAQALVKKLQGFISEHYYTCTDDILRGLGQMYAGGGGMTANIDRYGGHRGILQVRKKRAEERLFPFAFSRGDWTSFDFYRPA